MVIVAIRTQSVNFTHLLKEQADLQILNFTIEKQKKYAKLLKPVHTGELVQCFQKKKFQKSCATVLCSTFLHH